MKRHLPLLGAQTCVALLLGLLAPALVHAEGFGSPTMDGLLAGDEAIYNLVEASDSMDSPQGNAPMDLGDLYVANDATFWYFLFTVYADLSVDQWGKYILFVDTTNDTDGGLTDAWGRAISVADPHKAEYTVRSWLDGGGAYTAAKTQLWEWNQVDSTWSSPGPVAEAALAAGAVSGLEWKIPRAALGDPSTIWCSIANTGGGGSDNAQDTINDPAEDWNAIDWITPAVVSNSTEVALSSGTDTTPPTVVGACITDRLSFSDIVTLTFSEPVVDLGNTSWYSDLGGGSIVAVTQSTPTTVEVEVFPSYAYGACEQIAVTTIEDAAGNPIVANGTTNVGNFYQFQLLVRGNMSLHMQADDTPPHTFAIEGSTAPLTWDPLCDFAMSDADADSIYQAEMDFCFPCAESALRALEPTPQSVEFKFTHQCTEYETLGGNHFYTVDPGSLGTGVDTLDVFWNDEAPVDFTTLPVDVIFSVRSFASNPPFGSTDSLGLGGNALPLDWNQPPTNLMADDGVAPDATAGDGTYATRITFPAGTLKSVDYKYQLKAGDPVVRAAADSVFTFECSGQGDRNVFLDDTIFSTTNPIILALAHYDDCAFATGVSGLRPEIRGFSLDPSRPNPVRNDATIAYALPTTSHVRLDVYDVNGRHVRTLVDETRPEGRHAVVWNGRMADGRTLPTGVYFLRLEAGEFAKSQKVILMR
ncbi:MAG: hypothetical protein DHS20C21_01630 [Gemmatimonadota bacterium]|nr:MAG: hypothetical protein DHS20C21_01630 [Gemmatimonadota bacterium]